MPSKYGFETDEDREKERQAREARHAADQQHTSTLANQHDATITLILTDLADAHRKALGQPQVERHLGPGESWIIAPAGSSGSGPRRDWIVSVRLSVTDQQPSLTIATRTWDQIPEQNIDRLREVLEESTSMHTTAEGYERRAPRPRP